MSDDLISRKALFNELFVRNGKVCPNHDIDNFPINFNVKDIKQAIRNAPTAYDADRVIEQLKENEQEMTSQLEKSAKNAPDVIQETNLKLTAQLFRDYTKSQIEIVKSGGVADD